MNVAKSTGSAIKLKSIFISGIAGFIGSHLADFLLEKGYEVSGCDNMLTGSMANVPKKAHFYEIDCSQTNNLEGAFKKHKVDCVLHAAATAYDNFSLFSPIKITENIMGSTMSLMTASINADIKKFVYFSSMARYGNSKHVPFKENLVPEPVTPYGTAKFAAELGIKNLAQAHGMEYVICVPHNVYGPRQKFDDPFRNVISIMINRVLQGKSPIVYGTGDQLRSYTYISDVLPIIEKLMLDQRAHGEIFNIGPDNEFVSINDITKLICEAVGQPKDNMYIAGRPMEVIQAYCSSEKIREYFNYKTNISLKNGIEKTVQWIQSVGPKEFNYFMEPEIRKDSLPKTWSNKIM